MPIRRQILCAAFNVSCGFLVYILFIMEIVNPHQIWLGEKRLTYSDMTSQRDGLGGNTPNMQVMHVFYTMDTSQLLHDYFPINLQSNRTTLEENNDDSNRRDLHETEHLPIRSQILSLTKEQSNTMLRRKRRRCK